MKKSYRANTDYKWSNQKKIPLKKKNQEKLTKEDWGGTQKREF
jgi:hypothetical protein